MSRDNMEGTETENYVFAGICVPLGIFYLIMSIMNLLGEFLGSPGRRFIFEMDEVSKIFSEIRRIFCRKSRYKKFCFPNI